MITHSPAPWKLTELSSSDWAVADEHNRVIAVVMHMAAGDGEALANARLMVGSPTLLACLSKSSPIRPIRAPWLGLELR
jgi:hypothetical protein